MANSHPVGALEVDCGLTEGAPPSPSLHTRTGACAENYLEILKNKLLKKQAQITVQDAPAVMFLLSLLLYQEKLSFNQLIRKHGILAHQITPDWGRPEGGASL